MEQIAKKLTQYFLARGLIKEDDAEVCQYALYRHISRAVGLIALTLLGGLITDFGLAFCFTVSFLFLRERTGGYHAKTEWQCALYSAAMIFATMFALPIFAEESNNYWAIMIASSALIWVSSPADNKQIHLSRAESKAMAKRARLRLLLLDAVLLALLGVHGHLFASSIALAELSVAVSLMMAAAMTMGLAACGATASTDTAASTADATSTADTASSTEAAADSKVYRVGICQLVQHEALDAATQGFKDALTEKLGEGNVKFDEQNAAGDAANCVTITSKFAADGVDLILANATAPLQAAVSATGDIPILGTSITDYATALGMKDWNGTTGINVSGTSDLAPLDGQAAIIKELFPDAKNVGLIYCSAEANSIYQITVIKGYLEEMGYACTEFAFTDSNDVASVTQSAADASDVIYIPTDNTAAAYTETIANVLIPAKVPAVVGEEGICRGCGVATLSISYYDLGYKTGEMAADILQNGADVSTMAVESAPSFTKKYNAANAEALGLTIPADYVAIE